MGKDYIKPVLTVVDTLKNCDANRIFLTSPSGGGKTTVLNTYMAKCDSKKKPIINVTPSLSDHYILFNKKLADLYQICLIIKKMIAYIVDKEYTKYVRNIIFFKLLVDNIIDEIKDINTLQIMDNFKDINPEYLENPEILLDNFLDLIINYFDYDTITLIVDNFDSYGASSKQYQKLIYSCLFNRFRVIATISSSECLSDSDKMNELAAINTIIPVGYNTDLGAVKEILKRNVVSGSNKITNIFYRNVIAMLGDEVIAKMIEITNGDLNEMIRAIRWLTWNYDNLTPDLYAEKLLEYLENNLKYGELTGGVPKIKRTLYI